MEVQTVNRILAGQYEAMVQALLAARAEFGFLMIIFLSRRLPVYPRADQQKKGLAGILSLRTKLVRCFHIL